MVGDTESIESKEMCNYVCISIHFARCCFISKFPKRLGENEFDLSQRGIAYKTLETITPCLMLCVPQKNPVLKCHPNIACKRSIHRIC